MTSDTLPPADQGSRLFWFVRGVRTAYTLPAWILMSSFIGFAALAKAAGLTLLQTMFMVTVIWALPAQVVLIGAILAGSSLAGAAFAVALSSVRLAPMVISWVPELRGPRTRAITLYALSHFVAVTSWVMAMARARDIPRDMRTTWYFGVGSTLVITNTLLVGVIYVAADALPREISAALFMLTPMYFLTSLWGSAREWATSLAMVFGIVLGPIAHVYAPGFDLLIAGLIGGVGAWLIYVIANRRRAA